MSNLRSVKSKKHEALGSKFEERWVQISNYWTKDEVPFVRLILGPEILISRAQISDTVYSKFMHILRYHKIERTK